MIRLGSVLWEGSQKMEDGLQGQISSVGSERFEPHIGTPALVSDTVKMSPHIWLEYQWDSARNLESVYEEWTYTCLLLKQGGESRIKLHKTLLSFPNSPGASSSLSQAHTLAQLASWHSSSLKQGLQWPRRELSSEGQRQLRPRVDSEQGGVAIMGP